MATIEDIGTPGQPLAVPPLTEWQAAVRDAITETSDADAWIGWTPAVAGGTVTSSSCFYHRSRGGLVTVSIHLTLSAVSGSMTIAVPVPALAPGKDVLPTLLTDAATAIHAGLSTVTSAGVVTVYAAGGAAGGAARALSPTVPFTWMTGDMIDISGTYHAAPTP